MSTKQLGCGLLNVVYNDFPDPKFGFTLYTLHVTSVVSSFDGAVTPSAFKHVPVAFVETHLSVAPHLHVDAEHILLNE